MNRNGNYGRKQKLKIPVYVAEFIDKLKYKGDGLMSILQKFVEIYECFYGCTPDDQKEYRNCTIASWVHKFTDKNMEYDNLVMVVSDIYRNGYEVEDANKEFVIYDNNEEEFLDINFDLTYFERAMRFKTKESAKKFIMNNYEIQEIYVDERE